MALFKPFKKLLMLLIITSLVAACGGGSSNKPVSDPDELEAPGETSFKRLTGGRVIVSGKAPAKSTITVTFDDGSSVSGVVDDNGKYQVTSSKNVLNSKVKIRATDAAGHQSRELVLSVPAAKTLSANLVGDFKPAVPLIGLNYKTSLYKITGVTNSKGHFTYKEGETVSFMVAGKGYTLYPTGNAQNNKQYNQNQLLPITATADTEQNLKTILMSLDKDQNINNGIDLGGVKTNIDAASPTKTVIKELYKYTGKMPDLLFKPSLGINTEAPQGGADTVGMPMPFVDIFRTARPFTELSHSGTAFDTHGWPIKLAENFNFARTKLLQGTMNHAVPEGQYTVIYEGSGQLEFGSRAVSNVKKVSGENKYTFDLNLKDFDPEDEAAAADTNAFNMNIRGNIGGTIDLKNIRIVMPGGTCSGNPFIRVESQSDCPDGAIYQSFAERLEEDRNTIIFNPDYLMFLRNFKVIRMMNLMEASLKKLCFTPDDCPAGVGTWANRSRLDDAVWGGNDGRTQHEEHKGVPIEVMVALANTLKRDIWLNMPHIASDEYVTEYAKYVYQHLDPSIRVYIEYSNEVWNPGFAAHAYTTAMGKKLNLDAVPSQFVGSNRDANYFARLHFYSQRAVEIFDLWKSAFAGSSTRLTRVLGSFIGDRVLTEQMLKNIDPHKIDAVAIAPYFFGCPYKEICPDASKTLVEAKTVDDVFDAIDQTADVDVKSLQGTLKAVKVQLDITNKYNVKLVTYEGGQHLVTGVLGNKVSENEKPRLRKLFNQANRDSRMKQRYITFLNGWKKLSVNGTSLFTLYTLPQSFYRYGNFGLKEHLNKSRQNSPKFDGVLSFEEDVANCWWDGCSP